MFQHLSGAIDSPQCRRGKLSVRRLDCDAVRHVFVLTRHNECSSMKAGPVPVEKPEHQRAGNSNETTAGVLLQLLEQFFPRLVHLINSISLATVPLRYVSKFVSQDRGDFLRRRGQQQGHSKNQPRSGPAKDSQTRSLHNCSIKIFSQQDLMDLRTLKITLQQSDQLVQLRSFVAAQRPSSRFIRINQDQGTNLSETECHQHAADDHQHDPDARPEHARHKDGQASPDQQTGQQDDNGVSQQQPHPGVTGQRSGPICKPFFDAVDQIIEAATIHHCWRPAAS